MGKGLRNRYRLFFACAVFIAGFLPLANADAQTFSVLYAFTDGADGGEPFDAPILDGKGNLYGTAGCVRPRCWGTVFKFSPGGTLTTLYSFRGKRRGDGAAPRAGLFRDKTGSLFGTTIFGGINCPHPGNPNGCGTVFEVARDGHETRLHDFRPWHWGRYPQAGVTMDSAGNLYGTTTEGGDMSCPESTNGCGAVFKLAPDGTEEVLHGFHGGTDGYLPQEGVTLDDAGNLYGVTSYGGNKLDGGRGCGVVFKIAPDGTETVLHTFADYTDGCLPTSELLQDVAGNLYGTTFAGGSPNCGLGCGTVFRLAPDGTYAVLYYFRGGADGQLPIGWLSIDASGNLYGATEWGGSGCETFGCGTVFELTPGGTKTVLHIFSGTTDGQWPTGGVTLDAKGDLFGTAIEGGPYGYGSIWEIAK